MRNLIKVILLSNRNIYRGRDNNRDNISRIIETITKFEHLLYAKGFIKSFVFIISVNTQEESESGC